MRVAITAFFSIAAQVCAAGWFWNRLLYRALYLSMVKKDIRLTPDDLYEAAKSYLAGMAADKLWKSPFGKCFKNGKY